MATTAAISFTTSNIAHYYGYTTNESAIIGFTFAMIVGIGKEIYDDKADSMDILADAIGSGVGITPVYIIYEW